MDGIALKIRKTISHIIDSGAHQDVAKTTQLIAKKLGLSERLIKYTHIEIRNALNEAGFKMVPYGKRILFLPHCMRNPKKCRAKYGSEGLKCRRCGNCGLPELIKYAEELGYVGTYIVPGGSMMQKIVAEKKPSAIVGVCCYNEAQLAFEALRGKAIYPQAVLLLKDGCTDTRANVDEVKEKMRLISPELGNQEKS
jgi:hypothetical protein